jgi:iron(III) transport system ATP-binding protein
MVTHDQEEALTVADRIVVMNHGVIEQIGAAIDVYREPASPFVADFVGRVNVLTANIDAPGRVRVGGRVFACAHAVGKPGSAVKAYLRPEDVLARPIEPGDPDVMEGRIEKIEFLGSYCLVRVVVDGMESQLLTVSLSLNFLSEQHLAEGSRIKLRMLAERLRFFSDHASSSAHAQSSL